MCGDKFILELFSDHLEKHLECGVQIKTDADKNNVNVGHISSLQLLWQPLYMSTLDFFLL